MTKMKFEKHERLSRAEAADRLTEIAKALKNSGTFELDHGGETLELDVSEEVMLEFEVELKDGEAELEVELKWGPMTSSVPSTGSKSAS